MLSVAYGLCPPMAWLPLRVQFLCGGTEIELIFVAPSIFVGLPAIHPTDWASGLVPGARRRLALEARLTAAFRLRREWRRRGRDQVALTAFDLATVLFTFGMLII